MRRHDSPGTEPENELNALVIGAPARHASLLGTGTDCASLWQLRNLTRVKHVIRLNDRSAGPSSIALSFGAMLLLSGCGGNVEGKMLHAPESWTGDTSGSIAGSGSITLESDRGTHCEGPYRQVPNDT